MSVRPVKVDGWMAECEICQWQVVQLSKEEAAYAMYLHKSAVHKLRRSEM